MSNRRLGKGSTELFFIWFLVLFCFSFSVSFASAKSSVNEFTKGEKKSFFAFIPSTTFTYGSVLYKNDGQKTSPVQKSFQSLRISSPTAVPVLNRNIEELLLKLGRRTHLPHTSFNFRKFLLIFKEFQGLTKKIRFMDKIGKIIALTRSRLSFQPNAGNGMMIMFSSSKKDHENVHQSHRIWKRMGSGLRTLPGLRKNLVRRQFKEEEHEEQKETTSASKKKNLKTKETISKKKEDKKTVTLTDIPLNKHNLDFENAYRNTTGSSSLQAIPSKSGDPVRSTAKEEVSEKKSIRGTTKRQKCALLILLRFPFRIQKLSRVGKKSK
jgi:hypothetical protein